MIRIRSICPIVFSIGLFLIFLIISDSYAILTVEPNTIDFGEVKRDVAKKRYVTLRNTGDKPIKIIGIINQCGLNFDIQKKVILPFEITEGVIDFFSSTAIGHFNERIIIAYEEEGLGVKEATISVSWKTKPDIYPEIRIKPLSFDFGVVPLNRPINFELEITNRGTQKGSITVIKKDDGIAFENTNIEIGAGERKILKGTVVPTSEGVNSKRLTLEVKDFSSPLYEILFNYEAKKDALFGTYIELRPVERIGEMYRVPVLIENYNQDLKLISVETPDGKRISVSERLPFYIFKKGKKEFYLYFDGDEYERLKSSYYYFLFGIKAE